MRILTVSILFFVVGCAAVVRSPVPVDETTRIGIVSLVGDVAKNKIWGTTIFGNADLSKSVTWGIDNYINEQIRNALSVYGVETIIVTDERDKEGLSADILDGLSRLTEDAIASLDALRDKYGVDIVIVAKEYKRGEGNSALFTEGYGITKYPNETFVHTNITIYSIEVFNRNFFYPARLDGYAFEGFARKMSDSRPDIIDKETGKVVLDSATERAVRRNIDLIVDWYFRDYPLVIQQ